MNFFLSKIAVSNYQFSTLYHRNILIQLIFIKRVFLFHRFRKKISTVSFSIFIFYGTSRNQRQQTAFYNYRATFYNLLTVNCSNDKKINWKSIGKLCNVRGYLLRDRIVFASKNIERDIHDLGALSGGEHKIESRHFLPGQGAHKSFGTRRV